MTMTREEAVAILRDFLATELEAREASGSVGEYCDECRTAIEALGLLTDSLRK